jgi:tRNA guanosine-2'-O-methyltransferase
MCVVASLLTKLPNLANLTRTSEVLGISELVIPDKNILNDPIYTKVTVTAEKWIPIIECTEQNLPLFLKMKRENGFSVSPQLILECLLNR